jgi:glycosyltransferase involved in cell wall biosynthesis
MKSMCKISIIVPVYNTQNYLLECLNSIKIQTFSNFEVLLINDGSTDSSGDICNDFALGDNRFKVFHQENKGIGYVRNFGILNASGTYLIHVDSDDFVEPNFLETLHSKIETTQADVAFCDFFRFSENHQFIDVQKISLNTEDIIIGILTGYHFGALWNKLIRRSVFVKNNIQIDPEIKCFEDVLAIIEVLLYVKKVVYVNEALYNYRITSNSLTHARDRNAFLSAFLVVKKLHVILPENEIFQRALTEFKLQIRTDILLFGKSFNLPAMYLETNFYILNSEVLTTFQKVALILENKEFHFLLNLLLKSRIILKKMNFNTIK